MFNFGLRKRIRSIEMKVGICEMRIEALLAMEKAILKAITENDEKIKTLESGKRE